MFCVRIYRISDRKWLPSERRYSGVDLLDQLTQQKRSRERLSSGAELTLVAVVWRTSLYLQIDLNRLISTP
ncbi:hypothetical protein FOZ60_003722 [Perkinsus olseni]|uniref:Uncharacterized protein n=1 Tax=Perkinsus olseni TaxID=32597 RepID=A0A7J6PJH9_PEROL|nr:hypothetical protein FOZ60_003722 [Perkinsus olseni]